jgi:hypothetical protein
MNDAIYFIIYYFIFIAHRDWQDLHLTKMSYILHGELGTRVSLFFLQLLTKKGRSWGALVQQDTLSLLTTHVPASSIS